MWFRVLAISVMMACAGCQTPYQENGYSGGVSAQPVTNDVYRIVARGNGYTSNTTIQDYALLKAAETTLSNGGTHFAIMGNNNATRTSTQSTAGTFQTNVIGNTAFTTYNPGVNYDIVKPGQDLYIRVVKVPAGQTNTAGLFPAQEVFDNINPRVKRPKS